MTLAPGYGYAAKALQRLHRKLSITVLDGVQQMIFQRVAVLQHLDAEDGLFRQHTLLWQIGRFGGKICVVYPVGAEGAAVHRCQIFLQSGKKDAGPDGDRTEGKARLIYCNKAREVFPGVSGKASHAFCGAPRMSASCVLKSTAGTWYNYQTKAQNDEGRRIST